MTTGIQIRIDTELKKEAEKIFEELGIDTPTAIRIFLKKVIKMKAIPFQLTTQNLTANGLTPEEEMEILKASKEGPFYGPFSSAEEMLNDLHKRVDKQQ